MICVKIFFNAAAVSKDWTNIYIVVSKSCQFMIRIVSGIQSNLAIKSTGCPYTNCFIYPFVET